MSEDSDWKKVVSKSTEGANGFVKGSKLYSATTGHKFNIKFNTSNSCKVNVLTTMPNGKVVPAFRLDSAHQGVNFNHININPKISKIHPDPHLKLPPGGLAAGEGVARVCKVMNKVNKVAVPLAIAVDTVRVGVSVCEDVGNGTTRNTVGTVASVAGGWTGGYGGAVGGAAIGTAICPGFGTIIGGIIGGISGGVGGSMGASAIVEEIGDAVDYDVSVVTCKKCGKEFKVQKFRGEKSNRYCHKCR